MAEMQVCTTPDPDLSLTKSKSIRFRPTIHQRLPCTCRPPNLSIRCKASQAKLETDQDLEFYAGSSSAKAALNVSRLSSPTPEGGSPAPVTADRPTGFEDDFKAEAGQYSHTPSPLYDEDDSAELGAFPEKFTGDGWELMIRYPPKKKIMADRYWKPCYVQILLQASYSLSDVSLQAYDVYGKIHTVKLQHILYKERVGIRAGQISRLVEGHMTKYGMPLEHAAQSNILAKFACLNVDELTTFTNCVEDLLFHCTVKRESNPVHKQDEVQIHCYDEYSAHVDKDEL
uniref:SHD domain-containing protein n=1 Tax=Ditylenchus dipsaci TaxID=166011 RepID=A0A915DYY6_9BILA